MTEDDMHGTRPGRPRQNGARYPGGKLKPDRDHEENRGRAAWNRLKLAGVRALVDPKLGTEIGRLAMQGQLSDRRATAAFLIASTYGRYERLHGLPARSCASPDYNRAWVDGAGQAPGVAGGSEERTSRALNRFKRLSGCIPSGRVRLLVESLCVDDHHLSERELSEVLPVLDVVASHFGI